jgi:hypothetical protein
VLQIPDDNRRGRHRRDYAQQGKDHAYMNRNDEGKIEIANNRDDSRKLPASVIFL